MAGDVTSSVNPRPQVVVIGGPNGAGKTSAATNFLPHLLVVGEFVNADAIASGLAGFSPERTAYMAGRLMLDRLYELAAAHESFSFETTMASRTFAPWLVGLREEGYEVNVVFMWLQSAELALQRVRARVAKGGHMVPDDVVRRRYSRGISNFLSLYRPVATRWRVFDNSGTAALLVALGGLGAPTIVNEKRQAVWQGITDGADA